MNILEKVYKEIINSIPTLPPEIGGILGSVDGVVCKYKIDKGHTLNCGCFYSPNVTQLNDTIKKWQCENIEFCGIFHTHFFGIKSLSAGDVAYINAILQAMPVCISQLYFPVVVMPDKLIISYLAIRTEKGIEIKNDIVYVM